jgi:hypothetical protein
MTSALAGGEWSVSPPGRFTPRGKAPRIHWIGGLVDHRAGLDDVEERQFFATPGLELRPLGRLTHRKSLYRLSYHGFHVVCQIIVILIGSRFGVLAEV